MKLRGSGSRRVVWHDTRRPLCVGHSKLKGHRAFGAVGLSAIPSGPSHKQRSLLPRRTKRKKGTKVVAQALAPEPRIAEVEELCAIHKVNVTVALLFRRQWN
jgi:hypothetical protein